MVILRMTLMRVTVTVGIACFGILSWHLADAAGNPQAGEVIFDRHCKICHETGIKGAPKIGDKAAWAERIKQGESRLVHHAFFGHRKMPMHGDCAACTIQDFADAVAYIVSRSKSGRNQEK